MEKDYKFIAFDSKGKQIDLKIRSVINITEEKARVIALGIKFGLMQNYKDPIVIYEEV